MRNLIMAMMLVVMTTAVVAHADQYDRSGAEKLGWKLGIQAWTNNKGTLFETIDLAKDIGVDYLEMYPGQKISKDIDGKVGPEMTDEQIKQVLAKAKADGVTIITCGVMGIPSDEKGIRHTFEWANKMGLKYINSEPVPEAFPLIDKLAGEYGITVGIHDHPKPARYWNPDYLHSVLVKYHCKHIGFCADTGHWPRSGLDPVEVLKKYGDFVVDSHFKDLVKGGGSHNLHDVPWGTGNSHAYEMLEALKDHHFHGPFSIEYEWHWTKDDLRKCAKFFYETANKLANE